MQHKLKIKNILISLLLIICLFFPIYSLKADSGFDGSYDSGSSSSSSSSSSWSSGSSSSSSSSSDSSCGKKKEPHTTIPSNSKPAENTEKKEFKLKDFLFVIVMIIGCAVIILFEQYLKNDFNVHEVIIRNKNTDDNLDEVVDYDKTKILEVLPDFDERVFIYTVYQLYRDIQEAWMNAEMDAMRSLVTDELYNMYSMQVKTLVLKQEKNIMKDFNFYSASITKMEITSKTVSLYVNINLECFDYIVDKDGKTIRGNDKSKVWYNYMMIFTRSIEEKENKCPNCGATLESETVSTCKYCHTKIINKNYDWVLAKKMVISQTENVKK